MDVPPPALHPISLVQGRQPCPGHSRVPLCAKPCARCHCWRAARQWGTGAGGGGDVERPAAGGTRRKGGGSSATAGRGREILLGAQKQLRLQYQGGKEENTPPTGTRARAHTHTARAWSRLRMLSDYPPPR